MIALALLLATPLAQPSLHLAQAEQPAVEVWQLDQVRIARDTPEAKLKGLEPLHSLDAVVAYLKKEGIVFARSKAGLLPDRLPDQLRATIVNLPQGEPFVLPEADFISISVLIGRKLPPGVVSWRPRLSLSSAHKA
jgi:hypothetical protein